MVYLTNAYIARLKVGVLHAIVTPSRDIVDKPTSGDWFAIRAAVRDLQAEPYGDPYKHRQRSQNL